MLAGSDHLDVDDRLQMKDTDDARSRVKPGGRWELGQEVVEGDVISDESLQAYKAESTVFRQRFDDIFDDVERNLPTIHFDGSDDEDGSVNQVMLDIFTRQSTLSHSERTSWSDNYDHNGDEIIRDNSDANDDDNDDDDGTDDNDDDEDEDTCIVDDNYNDVKIDSAELPLRFNANIDAAHRCGVNETEMMSSASLLRSSQTILAALSGGQDTDSSYNNDKIQMSGKFSENSAIPSSLAKQFSNIFSEFELPINEPSSIAEVYALQSMNASNLDSCNTVVDDSIPFDSWNKMLSNEMKSTKRFSGTPKENTNFTVDDAHKTDSLDSLVALLASQINQSDASVERRDWSDAPSLRSVRLVASVKASRMGNIYEAAMKDEQSREEHPTNRRRPRSMRKEEDRKLCEMSTPHPKTEEDVNVDQQGGSILFPGCQREISVLFPEREHDGSCFLPGRQQYEEDVLFPGRPLPVGRSKSEAKVVKNGMMMYTDRQATPKQRLRPMKDNSRKLVSTFVPTRPLLLDLNQGAQLESTLDCRSTNGNVQSVFLHHGDNGAVAPPTTYPQSYTMGTPLSLVQRLAQFATSESSVEGLGNVDPVTGAITSIDNISSPELEETENAKQQPGQTGAGGISERTDGESRTDVRGGSKDGCTSTEDDVLDNSCRSLRANFSATKTFSNCGTATLNESCMSASRNSAASVNRSVKTDTAIDGEMIATLDTCSAKNPCTGISGNLSNFAFMNSGTSTCRSAALKNVTRSSKAINASKGMESCTNNSNNVDNRQKYDFKTDDSKHCDAVKSNNREIGTRTNSSVGTTAYSHCTKDSSRTVNKTSPYPEDVKTSSSGMNSFDDVNNISVSRMQPDSHHSTASSFSDNTLSSTGGKGTVNASAGTHSKEMPRQQCQKTKGIIGGQDESLWLRSDDVDGRRRQAQRMQRLRDVSGQQRFIDDSSSSSSSDSDVNDGLLWFEKRRAMKFALSGMDAKCGGSEQTSGASAAALGAHITTSGAHVTTVGAHITTSGAYVTTAGAHVITSSAGTYVTTDGAHVTTAGAHKGIVTVSTVGTSTIMDSKSSKATVDKGVCYKDDSQKQDDQSRSSEILNECATNAEKSSHLNNLANDASAENNLTNHASAGNNLTNHAVSAGNNLTKHVPTGNNLTNNVPTVEPNTQKKKKKKKKSILPDSGVKPWNDVVHITNSRTHMDIVVEECENKNRKGVKITNSSKYEQRQSFNSAVEEHSIVSSKMVSKIERCGEEPGIKNVKKHSKNKKSTICSDVLMINNITSEEALVNLNVSNVNSVPVNGDPLRNNANVTTDVTSAARSNSKPSKRSTVINVENVSNHQLIVTNGCEKTETNKGGSNEAMVNITSRVNSNEFSKTSEDTCVIRDSTNLTKDSDVGLNSVATNGTVSSEFIGGRDGSDINRENGDVVVVGDTADILQTTNYENITESQTKVMIRSTYKVEQNPNDSLHCTDERTADDSSWQVYECKKKKNKCKTAEVDDVENNHRPVAKQFRSREKETGAANTNRSFSGNVRGTMRRKLPGQSIAGINLPRGLLNNPGIQARRSGPLAAAANAMGLSYNAGNVNGLTHVGDVGLSQGGNVGRISQPEKTAEILHAEGLSHVMGDEIRLSHSEISTGTSHARDAPGISHERHAAEHSHAGSEAGLSNAGNIGQSHAGSAAVQSHAVSEAEPSRAACDTSHLDTSAGLSHSGAVTRDPSHAAENARQSLVEDESSVVSETSRGCHGVLLVLSPLVPMWCLGPILTRCESFDLQGVRIIRPNHRLTQLLGLSGSKFDQIHDPTSRVVATDTCHQSIDSRVLATDFDRISMSQPITVIHLKRDMRTLDVSGLLNSLIQDCEHVSKEIGGSADVNVKGNHLTSNCFHFSIFTEQLEEALGVVDFSELPGVDDAQLRRFRLPNDRKTCCLDEKQLIILSVVGAGSISSSYAILHELLAPVNFTHGSQTVSDRTVQSSLSQLEDHAVHPSPSQQLIEDKGTFELLAVRWLDSLDVRLARELTPYELDTTGNWQRSIDQLTTAGPALVFVLRGCDAYKCLSSRIHHPRRSNAPTSNATNCSEKLSDTLKHLMSVNKEGTYRLVTMLFSDDDFIVECIANELGVRPPRRNDGITDEIRRNEGRKECQRNEGRRMEVPKNKGIKEEIRRNDVRKEEGPRNEEGKKEVQKNEGRKEEVAKKDEGTEDLPRKAGRKEEVLSDLISSAQDLISQDNDIRELEFVKGPRLEDDLQPSQTADTLDGDLQPSQTADTLDGDLQPSHTADTLDGDLHSSHTADALDGDLLKNVTPLSPGDSKSPLSPNDILINDAEQMCITASSVAGALDACNNRLKTCSQLCTDAFCTVSAIKMCNNSFGSYSSSSSSSSSSMRPGLVSANKNFFSENKNSFSESMNFVSENKNFVGENKNLVGVNNNCAAEQPEEIPGCVVGFASKENKQISKTAAVSNAVIGRTVEDLSDAAIGRTVEYVSDVTEDTKF